MATVYLSTTGSDSNTYVQAQSISTPWLTPGKVLTSATAGDTCVVLDGTYTIAAGLTMSKAIIWQAQTNGAVVWDNNYGQHRLDMFAAQSFTGIKFYRWKHNTLFGCCFVHASGNNIGHVFTNCIFDDFKLNAYISNLGAVVGSNNTTGTTFEFNNCRFSNIIHDGTQAGTAIVANRNGNSTNINTFNNCTFYLPSTTAAVEKFYNDGGSASKPIVAGDSNIIYAATAITWGATGATMTYSTGYNVTSFPANAGNLTSDPLLVDPANSNFNLRPSSPSIGGGA